ncbi:MAG: hypothetical protein LBH72_00050 [Proteiniphilum sp.]|jgi:hypothetical protein|nr:hypothetical protein [Proteiniphilum sp.]
MYDSANLWINRVEAGNGFEASTNFLSNAKETVNRNTGEIWTVGSLDNLKVTVSMAGISIKGSLAKFLLPDNTYTLNRHQVKDALQKLSDDLHVDLINASVIRLDVAANFIVKHEPSRYFDALGLCRHFNRLQTAESTLSYQTKGKEPKKAMIFYDKTMEVQQRGGTIPDVYQGANLLRYESRWNTRLPQQLKVPEVKGRTLFDKSFYGKMIARWADNYFNIDKRKILKADAMERIETVSDAMDYICAVALQRLPPDEVQNILAELKQKGVFENRNYYSRLNKKLKDITGMADISNSDVLTKELDAEVRQVLAEKR